MSIEFIGMPNPLLTDTLRQTVRRKLIDCCNCILVRETDRELGLQLLGASARGIEEVTVSLQADQVYVGFHVGSTDQRHAFLRCIHSVLASVGISCDLEEQ